ncbi:MAG: hypothetical protein ACUVRY_07975 [Thermoanaerobaculaceae bacterium]
MPIALDGFGIVLLKLPCQMAFYEPALKVSGIFPQKLITKAKGKGKPLLRQGSLDIFQQGLHPDFSAAVLPPSSQSDLHLRWWRIIP